MKISKHFSLIFVLFLWTTSAFGQSMLQAIRQDSSLSAGNHRAYPNVNHYITEAPMNKKPFYISHYGRHGSRFLLGDDEYDDVCEPLIEGEKQNKLTPLGQQTLYLVLLMREDSRHRLGELTRLGAFQHRSIAHRMYEHFPEVFTQDCTIDARSTEVIRCILSMNEELMEFSRLAPHVEIKADASHRDMYYLNYYDRDLLSMRGDGGAIDSLNAFYYRHSPSYKRLITSLFNDLNYVDQNVDGQKFFDRLFRLAGTQGNTYLADSVSLLNLFTLDELYGAWKCANARWYMEYGTYLINGGFQPYTQRNLLLRIIEEADSCITLSHPSVSLRFGHDVVLLPLVCLMNLNGYGFATDDLEKLEGAGWESCRIFPMGANIQLVFYRENPEDTDIFVKALLNEQEVSLPIKTDTAPYYRWEDVRTYFLGKVKRYEN